MGATSKMIWKVLCVLYLATSSSVLCGAASVPAPPLELQEIILTGTQPTTQTALEQETAAIQPEEKDAESETQTPKLDDNDLNEVEVSPQTEKTESESEASSSVIRAINVDGSQDSLQTEATKLREADTNPGDQEDMKAPSPLETAVLVPEVTPSTTQAPPTQLSALERQSLIGHLVRISDQKSLVLTEKQKLALQQERSFQNQGYRAFSSASDQKGQTGFPEQPRRVQNCNQQQPQQQQFSVQQQQQFNFQQQQQFDFHQPPQFGTQQQQQFGSEQQSQLGLQQPQQQLFSPRQTGQFFPQLQQQFESTNEQFRGQLQQQRFNRIQLLDRVNNIQPQRVFQQEQLSQLQPQSNQTPGQQFRTNPEAVIRTPQQQEAALKKSLFSALQNSFIN